MVRLEVSDKAALIEGEVLERPLSYSSTREVFLRGLATTYLFAFTSYFLQIDGLYGTLGLIPVDEGTTIMDGLCFFGMLLSVFVAGLGWGNVGTMATLLWLYCRLLALATGPFYKKFSDYFLLEVGFIGVVYAPIWNGFETVPGEAPRWLVRFALFKILIMAGLQQLTSVDTAWSELTAVKHFFPCQLLPSPVAWYLHVLTLNIQEILCALVFVMGLTCSVLVLLPWPRSIRVAVSLVQICLQLFLFVIGNFGSLSFLTLVLCLALLDDGLFASSKSYIMREDEFDVEEERVREPLFDVIQDRFSSYSAVSDAGRQSTFQLPISQAQSPRLPISALEDFEAQCEFYLEDISCCFCIQATLASLAVIFCSAYYFGLYTLSTSVQSSALENIAAVLLPIIVVFAGCFLCAMVVLDAAFACTTPAGCGGLFFQIFCGLLAIVRGYVCCQVLLDSMGPLGNFSTTIETWSATYNYTLPFGIPTFVTAKYDMQWQGITHNEYFLSESRPEVVIEALDSASSEWVEIDFKYKPGPVERALPVVFTYQPRLDWEMWFQARDNTEQPWFTALLDAIQNAQAPVLNLLSVDNLPNSTVDAIRTRKYSYSLTNYSSNSTDWWTRTLDSNETGFEELLKWRNGSATDVLQISSTETLYEAASNYTDYRLAIVVGFFLMVMVLSMWDILVRTWETAFADDHGRAVSYDQSPQAAQLSITTTLTVVTLVTISIWVTSVTCQLIVIWIILVGGIAIQATANRAARQLAAAQRAEQEVEMLDLSRLPQVSRYAALHYLLIGVLVTVAFCTSYYVFWLWFGIGVLLGLIVSLLRIWTLTTSVAPLSSIAGFSIDLGLFLMLIIANSDW